MGTSEGGDPIARREAERRKACVSRDEAPGLAYTLRPKELPSGLLGVGGECRRSHRGPRNSREACAYEIQPDGVVL